MAHGKKQAGYDRLTYVVESSIVPGDSSEGIKPMTAAERATAQQHAQRLGALIAAETPAQTQARIDAANKIIQDLDLQ